MNLVVFDCYSCYVGIWYTRRTYNVNYQMLNWMCFLFIFIFVGISVHWMHHRRDYYFQGIWPKTWTFQFTEKPSVEHCRWLTILPAICPLGIPQFIYTNFCLTFLILLWTIINVIVRKMGACHPVCPTYRRATTVSENIVLILLHYHFN